MDLEKIIAVSGLPGLYKMAANRKNGLIVEHLQTGKKTFAASRTHQYTPLGSIAIYTDDGESIELKTVFRNMNDQLADNPPPDLAAALPEELHDYFADVLPMYDKDRVHTSDIKKVIKWFSFLREEDLLSDVLSQDTAAAPSDDEEGSPEVPADESESNPEVPADSEEA